MRAAVPADSRRRMATAMQAAAPARTVSAHDDARSAQEDEARGIAVARTVAVISAVPIHAAAAGVHLLPALVPLRALRIGLLALDALATRRRNLALLVDRAFLRALLRSDTLLLRRALFLRSRTRLRRCLRSCLRRGLRRGGSLATATTTAAFTATAFTAAAPLLTLSLSLPLTRLLRLRL